MENSNTTVSKFKAIQHVHGCGSIPNVWWSLACNYKRFFSTVNARFCEEVRFNGISSGGMEQSSVYTETQQVSKFQTIPGDISKHAVLTCFDWSLRPPPAATRPMTTLDASLIPSQPLASHEPPGSPTETNHLKEPVCFQSEPFSR